MIGQPFQGPREMTPHSIIGSILLAVVVGLIIREVISFRS